MELALICAQQVIVLFLLIGAGAAAIKTGVLKPEGRQTLSNLLVYLVVPAMIVHSYMMDFSEEILHNLLAAFGLSVLAILIGTVLTLALTARQKDRRAPIFRFASVFSNAAYMGFPLISALFGSEGLLYASAYVTVFNILLWTMGYGMVSGSSSPKEVARSLLRTPVLYAMVVGLAVYLLQIPVPALIAQPLELLSNMNTPLSMLITGILIATGDLKQIVCDRHIWKLAGLRMLVIPAVCLAAFAALVVIWVVIATLCSLFVPLVFNKNNQFAHVLPLRSPRCSPFSSATMSSSRPDAWSSPPCSASSPCPCAHWC